MIRVRLFLASLATALGLGVVALTPIPASAQYACSIQSPNVNFINLCADANFITGQGRVVWEVQNLNPSLYTSIEIQTKTGTNNWISRGYWTNEHAYHTGSVGFATPPPNTNTKVRIRAASSGGVGYFNVPIGQI